MSDPNPPIDTKAALAALTAKVKPAGEPQEQGALGQKHQGGATGKEIKDGAVLVDKLPEPPAQQAQPQQPPPPAPVATTPVESAALPEVQKPQLPFPLPKTVGDFLKVPSNNGKLPGKLSRRSASVGGWIFGLGLNSPIPGDFRHFAIISPDGVLRRQLVEHEGKFYDVDEKTRTQEVMDIPAAWASLVETWYQTHGKPEWAIAEDPVFKGEPEAAQ